MDGSAIIFDTETTGLDEPDVIELAHTRPMESPLDPEPLVSCLRFKPRKGITYAAMATHHIFEAELGDAAPWTGAWSPPAATQYLVGHNVDFDWKAIGSPDLKRICTLALSRKHWPDVDSHSLGAMTYATATQQDCFELRDRLRFAHSADTDVLLTHRLLRIIVVNLGMQTWEQLWEASEIARVPERMTFGKYGKGSDWAKAHNKGEGMRCANVRKYDGGYYDWLINKCDQVRDDPYLKKALTGE